MMLIEAFDGIYRQWDLKAQYQYYLMKQTQTEMDG
jgi:hypothetical protein